MCTYCKRLASFVRALRIAMANSLRYGPYYGPFSVIRGERCPKMSALSPCEFFHMKSMLQTTGFQKDCNIPIHETRSLSSLNYWSLKE